MHDLESMLLGYGLSDIEVKVYLGLLQLGQTTVLELARFTGIKRATVHFNVEGLIKKGLVAQTMVGSKRVIMAEPPEKLGSLIEERKRQIIHMENTLPKIIDQVKNGTTQSSQNGFTVQVKYYEGRSAVKAIYNDLLTCNTEIRSYASLSKLKEIFPENGELFEEILEKNPNLIVKEIIDVSENSENYAQLFAQRKNFLFKLTPKSIKLADTDVLMYDDKIAVVSLAPQISGMVMHNKEYYEISKAIFDFLWDMLPS